MDDGRHFSSVVLYSREPARLAAFYRLTLALAVERVTDERFVVPVGSTQLAIEAIDRDIPAYHVAFAGPLNGIAAAKRFLIDRVPLLTKDAESDGTYAFDFIGADAVYFADPDENVLEIICRRDAAGDVATSFTMGDAAGLCEVGLPIPTLPPLLDRLRVKGGLTVWNGNRERFAMVGSPGASLIVVPSTAERTWLSSDKSCLTTPFEATIPTPSGATHIRVSGDEIAIYTR